MGSVIVKATQDADRFGRYDTTCSRFVQVSTRQDILDWARERWGSSSLGVFTDAIDRAGRQGTSSLTSRPPVWSWDDTTGDQVARFDETGLGRLTRDRLAEYLDAVANGDHAAADALLLPAMETATS
jgi:hypothetical protein